MPRKLRPPRPLPDLSQPPPPYGASVASLPTNLPYSKCSLYRPSSTTLSQVANLRNPDLAGDMGCSGLTSVYAVYSRTSSAAGCRGRFGDPCSPAGQFRSLRWWDGHVAQTLQGEPPYNWQTMQQRPGVVSGRCSRWVWLGATAALLSRCARGGSAGGGEGGQRTRRRERAGSAGSTRSSGDPAWSVFSHTCRCPS